MRLYLPRISDRWIVVLQSLPHCGYRAWKRSYPDYTRWVVRCGAFYISTVRKEL
jgi:hypothetical protein